MNSKTRLSSNFLKHNSHNPIQKKLLDSFNYWLLRLIGKLDLTSILDAGCGEGFTLNQVKKKFPDLACMGLDVSLQAIKLGRKLWPKIKFKTGDIYRLPFRNNSFDLVICSEVLEHLSYPEKALKEIVRVSNKYCLLSVPNEPWFTWVNFLRGKYLSTWGNHPEHINHWSEKTFKNLLKANHLEIIQIKRPFPWVLILTKTIFKAN